jgi:isopenicillin N synthase-like dioxygenase
MELSTLDFAYAHAAADKCLRKCFCERLIAALSYSGFVKLVNHGISVSLIEEAFKWVSTSDKEPRTSTLKTP